LAGGCSTGRGWIADARIGRQRRLAYLGQVGSAPSVADLQHLNPALQALA
jgi:hypothetical protein